MKTTDSVMSQEVNKCDFCGEVKPVLRHYLYVKNKHFDDNKGGCYSTFVSYCQDCGIDSHSLAEARREERDRRNKKLEGLKKVVEYNIRKQEANFDVSLRMYNKGYLKALDDLLTGDNPEEGK